MTHLQFKIRWKFGRPIQLFNEMQKYGYRGKYETAYYIFKGEHQPTVETLKYIARALHTSIDELVEGGKWNSQKNL